MAGVTEGGSPLMDVCSKISNRTAPVSEGVPRRADVPLCSRTNGWSWPPHPFQLLAWLLYLYFAVTGFGVCVPLLPTHWIPAGYIVSLFYSLSHGLHRSYFCTHLHNINIHMLPCSSHSKLDLCAVLCELYTASLLRDSLFD